ncbi:MAG: prolyl oligopeptidase family serine peptidase, partial [Candidatus Babeliales bacterium]|nr:prolyl oligopeptidase family serine peptidase [Candidatus Babeliales bacterium]
NYLYAHGLAESYKQAYWYSKTTPHGTMHDPYLYDGRLFSFDFPDATERFWRMNFTQTSLAQANEIEALRSTYDQARTRLADQGLIDQDFVLMGMSRGATTILNFMSIYKPEKVKAIIVESPFDSTRAVAKNMLSKIWLDNIIGMQTLAHALVGLAFWQYSTDGIHAIEVVEYISKDLPILLIASNQDALVPVHSTIALYNKIKQSGHTKVHIYVADLGRHGRFLRHENGRNYQNVVQAFYRTYGLPHDAALADLGQDLFDGCQFDTFKDIQ